MKAGGKNDMLTNAIPHLRRCCAEETCVSNLHAMEWPFSIVQDHDVKNALRKVEIGKYFGFITIL